MFCPSNNVSRQCIAGPDWLIAFAILVALSVNSACTGPNATAGAHYAAAAQASRVIQSPSPQTDAMQTRASLPPAGLSPQIADAFREAQAGSAKAMAVLGAAYEKGKVRPWISRKPSPG